MIRMLPENGMIHLESAYPVFETVRRMEAVLAARGLPVLAKIDHGAGAAKAGLAMPPTELLIFGNAKSGTPLMLAAPTLALDLPLKALIWEDGAGKTWVSYNSPEYLRQRHGIPEHLLANIAGIRSLVEEVVSEA